MLDLFERKAFAFLVYSAALILMVLTAAYIPLFCMVALIFIPLPPALLVRRLNLWYGLASLLLTGVILFAVTGNVQAALFLTLQTGPLGVLLGLLFKNHVSSGKALALTVSLSVLVAAGMFSLLYFFTGASPFTMDQADRSMFSQIKMEIGTLSAQGMDPARTGELETMVDQIAGVWPVISTSSTVIWLIISAFLTYSLSRWAMRRSGYNVPAAVPFDRWRLPWYLIWGVIAGLLMLMAGDEMSIIGLKEAGQILLWITAFIMAVLGASVTSFFLKKWLKSWLARLTIIAGLIIFARFTLVALVVLGLTDNLLNIRRLSSDGRSPEGEEKR